MKRAMVFLSIIAAGMVALTACHLRAHSVARAGGELDRRVRIAGALELTDLSIWTEARFTRHPSQADLFSAFQESPAAPDHFPAGSIIAPARAR